MFHFWNTTLDMRDQNALQTLCIPSPCMSFVLNSEQMPGGQRHFNSRENTKEMDVNKMLVELRQERESIEEAILILERLARGRGKRRGRPPAWMASITKTARKPGRPPGRKPKEDKASA